jgi:hypothetical protein
LAGLAAFIVWAAVPPDIFIPLIPPALSVIFTLVLFVAFLVTLTKLLRFAWGSIPTAVINSMQLDKVLAALISLALFPAIANYAWDTFQALMRLFPELIRVLAGFDLQASCSSMLGADAIRRCASDVANELGKITSQFASRIMNALNLDGFPLEAFVWFLMSAVILTQLMAYVRQRLVLDDVVTWSTSQAKAIGSTIASIPTVTWQRIVFTALVVISFYLGLTALLAIPLLNEKSRSQHTVDDIAKAIEVYLIKFDAFPAQLPQVSLPVTLSQESSPTLGKNAAQAESVIKSMFDGWATPMVDQLQEQWARVRSGAEDTQRRATLTAKNSFAATLDGNFGKQHTDRHYYELLKWFSDTTIAAQAALSRCHDGATKFVGDSSQALTKLKSALAQNGDDTSRVFRDYSNDERRLIELHGQVLYQSCIWTDFLRAPDSPTIASGLGAIGRGTSWLIDTERMPVVIIVGLVGFSLLGATVSRAVRVQDDNRPRAAFTLDDLLTVIAGGTTAAVVVFLAAYGGLALLGNSTGDPNAYIVFATCLVAAVYSEDVWTWARRRLLDTELRARNRTRRRRSSARVSQARTARPTPAKSTP